MVLDASAVVELLLGSRRGDAVTAAIRDAGTGSRLHAPDLVDLEVAQVFRRLVMEGAVQEWRARSAMDLLARMPVRRHPARALLPRVWSLRQNLTAYDAAYVALAEALGAPLLTCDAHLARAPGHGADVIVV